MNVLNVNDPKVYMNDPDVFKDPECYETLKPVGIHDSTANAIVEVSPEMFDKIAKKGFGDQVSLTISDYAYTERVLSSVHKLGYTAISPYVQGSTRQNEVLAAERMQTLKVCLAALVSVLALQIVVLRAMFSAETENYRLLSNIGLICKDAKASVFLQVLVFTVLGRLLGGGGIALCAAMGIERVVAIMRYLPPTYILLLSAVHFGGCLVAAAWVTKSLGKLLYPYSSKPTDLDWTELEEAEK